jgi:hypothetical protein
VRLVRGADRLRLAEQPLRRDPLLRRPVGLLVAEDAVLALQIMRPRPIVLVRAITLRLDVAPPSP